MKACTVILSSPIHTFHWHNRGATTPSVKKKKEVLTRFEGPVISKNMFIIFHSDFVANQFVLVIGEIFRQRWKIYV